MIRTAWGRVAAAILLPSAFLTPSASADPVRVVPTSVVGTDGGTYTVTNHLVGYGDRWKSHEWLLVWAGGAPTADGAEPDFLAVVDASPDSPTYGKVVNTATVGPQSGNEPHHLQYTWHQGQRLYAGGILSDTVFVLDVDDLPLVRITGVNLPMDTPCGTAPDAFAVLRDGTAYGTYMGGPNVPGPCTYTNGEVRQGNGFAGTPGEVVRLDEKGRTLAELPAASLAPEDAVTCPSVPALPVPSCANPHGIQVREDLDRMITSDYVEIRNLVGEQTGPGSPYLYRDTVRIWDISDRDDARVVSKASLPKGPRPPDPDGYSDEQRMVMEVAVTNRPGHRGAFASTMLGGAVFYTPDITSPSPQWREVFDDTAAYASFQHESRLSGAYDGASWLQVSPDDRYLYHTVMGTNGFLPRQEQTGMVYVLDIRDLVASGDRTTCSVDELAEVERGGFEPDCPKLVDAVPIRDAVSPDVGVGPHWGTLDTFERLPNGKVRETDRVTRLAVSNYFVAAVGLDGDHRVCMINQASDGTLSEDVSFRDEHTGTPCVQMNRTRWPHGATGFARPHGVLFAVSEAPRR
ncbi:selenium-binding protein SBP56-related protein [Saccharothrix sp. NRRL B-16314]|uniref:selenium-binding protein SBP56-related protein n=1 Tax=Saccharothrix sp. NRRL B-16314 TaxID=1463825 RepID=UPI0009DE9F82|nr:selenium-binding protein SBP56-related protein [Saccharothrix sp. NRRL B-16314]